MRSCLASWVISSALALAACDGGGDGGGSADGGGGFLGGHSGTSGSSGGAGASGSSGAGGQANVDTGLPDGKVLGEVTPAEAQSLCSSLARSASRTLDTGELRRFTCTLSALPSAIREGANGMPELDRAACERAVSECLAMPDEAATEDNCASSTLAPSLMGCEATAGELEACLGASLTQVRNLIDTFRCSTPVSELMMGGGFEEPTACEAFDTECPGVLDAIGAATEVLPNMDGDDG